MKIVKLVYNNSDVPRNRTLFKSKFLISISDKSSVDKNFKKRFKRVGSGLK
jgi:hypothetical protein